MSDTLDQRLIDAGRALLAGDADRAEKIARQLTQDAPEDAAVWHLLGRALNNLRRLPEAVAALERAANLRPDEPEVLEHLGHVLRASGDLVAAANRFRAALAIDESRSSAWFNLGTTLAGTGESEAARQALLRCLALAPEHSNAKFQLAQVLASGGALESAIEVWRDLLSQHPQDADARCNLAALLLAQGQDNAAEQEFRQALQQAPTHPAAAAGLAAVLERNDRIPEATAVIESVPYSDRHPTLLLARASLARRQGDNEAARSLLESMLAKSGIAPEETGIARFLLGAILDEAGEYDAAFALIDAANRAQPALYSATAYQQRLAAVQKLAGARVTLSNCASRRPVFIVGMPRSGTSLVEQLLATHPDLHGGGELGFMPKLARAVSFPAGLATVSAERLTAMAEDYLASLNTLNASALHVSDKMWQNFEYLGLVHRLFPAAAVIHCTRHPLDTGLSCYFQSFGAAGPPFCRRLESIGHYYGYYRAVMRAWQNQGLSWLNLPYESLLDDPELWARRLLAHVGLAWDPAVLRFWENPRKVRTASSTQVRRPLYNSSVARWRHYEKQLSSLRAIIGDEDGAGILRG